MEIEVFLAIVIATSVASASATDTATGVQGPLQAGSVKRATRLDGGGARGEGSYGALPLFVSPRRLAIM